MDIQKIIELYEQERWSLRMIANLLKTNHHKIKRILLREGVKVPQPDRYRQPITDEHREKISVSCKGRDAWSKGLKMSKESLYKNMKNHLKYDVSLEWLMQFENIEKLKVLNKSLSRKRDYKGFTTGTYQQFIEKFYKDDRFNILFDKWVTTGDKWMKPSLDHVKPKSNGGSLYLDNLQFISWFENRAKADIEQEEWSDIKKNIQDYFI